MPERGRHPPRGWHKGCRWERRESYDGAEDRRSVGRPVGDAAREKARRRWLAGGENGANERGV